MDDPRKNPRRLLDPIDRVSEILFGLIMVLTSTNTISVLTAGALLAEAAAATAIGRPWQLSWWLWHVLLVLAFAFVAYTAHIQYRREGASATLFR